MAIVCLGLNHKTAPIELLERLAIPEDRLDKALHQLTTYDHVVEGAVLSTCNRVEAYAVVTKFHGGAQDLRNFFAEFCHVAPEDFADHTYTYHDDGAVRHLFRVAAGIDSMIVGETEILGQVRRAFSSAQEEGTCRRVLSACFRAALRAGKRARHETKIARNPASISSAAVELARRAFADASLAGRRVVVVGAGEMGRLAVTSLVRAGAQDLVVVNRSEERALELADAYGVTPRPMADLVAAIADADIVISSTTATATIISKSTIERALANRVRPVPLFIVDIAVPRDVEAVVAELPGVVLRDIEDLRGVVESTLGSRMDEVSKVEHIVANELGRFMEWERATEAGPTIAAIVHKAEELRRAELRKVEGRLKDLSSDERKALEQVTKQIVAKILHAPIEEARELGGSKQGHLYLAALRELFRLDDEPHP